MGVPRYIIDKLKQAKKYYYMSSMLANEVLDWLEGKNIDTDKIRDGYNSDSLEDIILCYIAYGEDDLEDIIKKIEEVIK